MFIENIHDLRDNILYMLSFQKVVKEDVVEAMEELILLNGCKSKRKI